MNYINLILTLTNFDFFKDWNSDSEGNGYEGQLGMDDGTLEQINSHINLPIRKDEIFKCVRKLKNEKASGEDEIINECIWKVRWPSLLIFMKNYLMLYLIMVLCLAVG